jgi:hypothetical protein
LFPYSQGLRPSLDQAPSKAAGVPASVASALASAEAGPAPANAGRDHPWHEAWQSTYFESLALLADLARCVLGNPFRPVTADPAWRTSTAVALAEAIHAERAFDRLPILADALEEAGCADEAVLAHCRADDAHARGCWVVEMVRRP